jgi:hypothetical protein
LGNPIVTVSLQGRNKNRLLRYQHFAFFDLVVEASNCKLAPSLSSSSTKILRKAVRVFGFELIATMPDVFPCHEFVHVVPHENSSAVMASRRRSPQRH